MFVGQMNCFVKYSTFRILNRAARLARFGSQSATYAKSATYTRIPNRIITSRPDVEFDPEMETTVFNESERLMLKRRIPRNKSKIDLSVKGLAQHPVVATSTADEYELAKLRATFEKVGIFRPVEPFKESYMNEEVVHFINRFDDEEFFVFKEGTVVFWNMSASDCKEVLKQLKEFEINPYDALIVQNERDVIDVAYTDTGLSKFQNGLIHILDENNSAANLEKFAFSHALSLSAKLSILEAKLSQYIDTIQNITWEIQEGRKSKLNRKQVYQKTGRFYGLRHRLKMNSHLVSVPEFYWRRRELEELFLALRNHLKVSKRAEALKEKLVHCVQLMNLVQNNLDTLHHSRLEKMIIVLISIEIIFQLLHYVERFIISLVTYSV